MESTKPLDTSEQFEGNVYLFTGSIILGLKFVITLFGLVGNVLSMIVWSRPHLKSSSSAVLISLAVCDTLVILCGLWENMEMEILALALYTGGRTFDPTIFYFMGNYYTQWSLFVSTAVHKMAMTATVYLTLIITVERYICVCHPFRFNDWSSYSRTCRFVVITIIFSVMYRMKYVWEYKVVEDTPDSYDVKNTELLYDPLYGKLNNHWIFLSIDYFLPLTCIITMNTFTYIKLKKNNKERRAMTDSQGNDNKLTTMLLYVVVEFLMFTSISGFITIANMFPGTMFPLIFNDLSRIYLFLELTYLLNSLNSSVNFITYVSSRPPFRKAFIEMFCCHKGDQPTSTSPGNPNQTPRLPLTRTTSV